MITLYDVTKPITKPLGDTYRYLTGQKKSPERLAIRPIDDSCLEALVSTDKTTSKQVVEQIIKAYDQGTTKDPRIKSLSPAYQNQTDYLTVEYTSGESRAYPVINMGGFFIIKELITMGNQCPEEKDHNFVRIFKNILESDKPSNPDKPLKTAA